MVAKGVKLRKSQSIRGADAPGLPTTVQCPSDEKKPRSLPINKVNWDAYMRSGPPAVTFWLIITFAAILLFAEDSSTIPRERMDNRILINDTLQIVFSSKETDDNTFYRHLKLIPIKIVGKPDYGDLERTPSPRFTDSKLRRAVPISDNAQAEYETVRSALIDDIDDRHNSDSYSPDSDKEDKVERCRRVSWAGYTYPSCNGVHEMTIGRVFDGGNYQNFNVSYLNSGSYRDAWRFKRSELDHFVLKRLMLVSKHTWDAKDLFKIHREQIILERMSPSPRVLDIYGSCGTTVLVEAMRSDLHTKIITGSGIAKQETMDELDDVYPLNNFTASEKLQISFDMAESLADLHGFEGGPIVHADTHIEQWLIAPDGSIRLNDFNNAHEPEWDARAGDYCTTHNGYGGVWRAPEEFVPEEQDETRDIYAYGNNIYTLLTGLWPFYDEEYRQVSHDSIRQGIIKGRRPFIDPRYRKRSYIEEKLVEIMEKCWIHDRTKRPSIFEVVDFLREVKKNAVKLGELKPSSLIKISSPETS